MDESKLRAWWFHRQGLDGGLDGQPAALALERTGWARSVGGSGPYLGLHARCGAGRAAIDRDVETLAIHELPSARGCTYVVPASAFALALRLSQAFGPEADMRLARKLGVTDAEIDRLCAAVLDALGTGPLAPDELRAATGGAARSLGEEGKKKGLTTTLPLALGRLQSAGEIRRLPTNGRLDQQRYRYTLWRPNPLAGFRLSAEECNVQLARLFFTWIGPATVAEFQAFAGLGAKAAKAAVEPLHLVPPPAEDAPKGGKAPRTAAGVMAPRPAEAGERLVLPEQREELAAFTVPREPCYALVGSVDGLLLLRRDVRSLLAPEDLERTAAGEKGMVEVGGLVDLPNHAILDRGRLVGLWEYDPEAGEIAWTSFVRPDAALRERVRAMEEFIREDLGDARSFSLDSPKSRRPRLERLRTGAVA